MVASSKSDTMQVRIQHGVDARCLAKELIVERDAGSVDSGRHTAVTEPELKLSKRLLPVRGFDRVVFNFPLAQQQRITVNQRLLRDFFASAADVLRRRPLPEEFGLEAADLNRLLPGTIEVQQDSQEVLRLPMQTAFRLTCEQLVRVPLQHLLDGCPTVWVTLCGGQGGTAAEAERHHRKIGGHLKNSWDVVNCAASAGLVLAAVGPPETLPHSPGGYSPPSLNLSNEVGTMMPGMPEQATPSETIPKRYWEDCRMPSNLHL
eukprot:gnl/TRDRNA2_/TRDRNA2_164811_c0_seq6.p1 gnl/TRDRNA2_/TRDRNA2_164811_c0~~gnl/TRDRNA2_/TRDRNA2_164811_c0_seq6.p1  ORF type:complete len:262 (+),score=38.49 gnl/TRDRNA2_/TRDRNA2_164811_c0_seq6:393-1178(+)